MGKGGWQGKLYAIAEWITMLAVLQLMWTGLTLLGLVVFGISPATAGLFSAIRKRLQGQDDLKGLVSEYWRVYKEEWVAANKIGLVLIVVGYFLATNLRIVFAMPTTTTSMVILVGLTMITILYLVLCMNIFQVFTHYELPFSRYFSTSVLLMVSFPIQGVGSLIGVYLLYQLFLFLPGLLPFFGVSVTAIFLSWMSFQIFKMKDAKETTIPA